MTIEPGSATLPGGSSMKFTATIKDEHGLTTFPVDVSWLSSNQSVAAARAGGVVQGISAGQTQIIATWRNARATARVTVTGRSSKKPDLPACPRVEASGRSLVIPTDGAEC
ncbi:MAG: Ig-like domain-containing protein [Gemmatimonadales bacterium]|nr:Ig-like domain-containing protein [Gemmatimonadales bacterium]